MSEPLPPGSKFVGSIPPEAGKFLSMLVHRDVVYVLCETALYRVTSTAALQQVFALSPARPTLVPRAKPGSVTFVDKLP